jgi:hypothetical protein
VTIFERALDGYTKIYHPPWPFIKEGLPSIYKGVRVGPFFVTIFERVFDLERALANALSKYGL